MRFSNEQRFYIRHRYDALIHIITRWCPTGFKIYTGNFLWARLQILIALSRHRKVYVFRCLKLFGVGVYLLSYSQSGKSENILSADTLVVIKVRVNRHPKMSALVPLDVAAEFSVGTMFLYTTKSVSYSNIRKCLSTVDIPFSDQNRIFITWLNVHVF